MISDSTHYKFKHHPETCSPDDYWGQVKRTVGGKPIAPEQIELMVGAIAAGLTLEADDLLLDLCCGNGALTSRVFALCGGGLGVDYSPFLIDVAHRNFVSRASERYRLGDALAYVTEDEEPHAFTKVLCYGAYPYFSEENALRLLQALRERFRAVSHIYLGQLPDRTRMQAFFTDRQLQPGEESDPAGLMGIWRSPEAMVELARKAGWRAECRRMPAHFYAAHYRFDAILTRF